MLIEFSQSLCEAGEVESKAKATPAEPLGSRYWKLWTSSALSNLADGVMKVALPLVAIRYTDSPGLIAGLTFAFTLPWLVFALLAGALADRYDRRRLMLVANTARAAFLAFLTVAAVAGAGSIWLLYAAAICIGVAETVYDTSSQSILPQLVSKPSLSRANGRLYAAELTTNQFVGPPLGGFLVAAGIGLAFGTPVLLWVAAIGMLLLVRGRFTTDHPRTTTIRADIAEGLRAAWEELTSRRPAAWAGVCSKVGILRPVLVFCAVQQTRNSGLTPYAPRRIPAALRRLSRSRRACAKR